VNPLYDGIFFIFSPLLALGLGIAISGTVLTEGSFRFGDYEGSAANLFIGVFIAALGELLVSSIVLLMASLLYVYALRVWEPLEREPKLRGIHSSAPFFIRSAFGWLAIAGVLAIVSTALPLPNGYAGAGRHALTVGFFSIIVFVIAPRVLPAFFNVTRLWSPRLMAVSLTLLSLGCTLRVSSQILAYEQIAAFAWKTLSISAIIEMTAVTLFAANMLMTLTTGSPLENAKAELAARSAAEAATANA
jgi:hypothetical protein